MSIKTSKKEFVPKRIGEENASQSEKVQNSYYALVGLANNLRAECEKCLKTNLSLDEFLDFLRNDPENWIYKKYVEINKIEFPGLSFDKLFELKLLDIEGMEDVLTEHGTFMKGFENVKKTNFVFPLRKFYCEEENIFIPDTDDLEFTFASEKHFSKYTENEEQNIILAKIEKICVILNELDKLGILRAKHGVNEISTLTDYIQISKFIVDPTFVVDRFLFYKHRTTKYRVKTTIPNQKTYKDFFV